MPIEQPPITIGELTNVPAPESGIRSPWAQAVSSRIIHRFATVGAMTASNLAVGARCIVTATDPPAEYLRIAAGFARQSPWVNTAAGGAITFVPPSTALANAITIPSDVGPRVASISCNIYLNHTLGYAAGVYVTMGLELRTAAAVLIDEISAAVLPGPVRDGNFIATLVARIPANTVTEARLVCKVKPAGGSLTNPGGASLNGLYVVVTPDVA